jgi:hypothetical protein
MAAQDDLWTAVKADYDSDGLVTLTNIRNRAALTINDSVGVAASLAVINLWPMHAQAAYDSTNAAHVEVAEMGVIAMLWRRGGSASSIEQVKWDEVFGDNGLISKIRQTGARSHRVGVSNSGVSQSSELDSSGSRVLGWSDRNALPVNYLPTTISATDD